MSAGTTDLRPLASRLEGRLILAGDVEYEQARHIWNGMIDKRPRAIAQCANRSDVTTAIQFATSHDVQVSVRGGGHNVAGNAVCDDGLVIDMSPMKEIRVDREQRRARAGGGVLWGAFDAETQKYGLATTGGLVSTTGIAGFTLGGGLGYLMRSYGLACDNLVSADLVTAEGEWLVASAEANDDLFWAVRGGGGNFGVVTSFEFRLHEVGPQLLAGSVVYPFAQARDVLRFYRDWTQRVPDNLTVYAGIRTADNGAPVVGVRVVYNGAPESGTEVVNPLRQFGAPLMDDIRLRAYTEVQKLVDPMFPPGRRNYWKANFLDDLSDELIDIILDAFARVPSHHTSIAFEQMGGAMSRIGEADTAFYHRNAAFSLLVLGNWEEPQASETNVAWVRSLWERTRPFSSAGVYVNYLGIEGDERVHDAYGINYARLVEVKRKYDPHNVFRLNQNIRSGTTAS